MNATFTAKNVPFKIEPRSRESLSHPGIFVQGHVLVVDANTLLNTPALTRWDVQDAALAAGIGCPLPGTWISFGGRGSWFDVGNGEIATWVKV